MKERIQKSLKESLTAVSMRKFLGINSLYPEGRVYFNDVVLPSMLRGEKRWPSWDSEKLLAGFEMKVEGDENIDVIGSNLFVINHWAKGPLHAWWHSYMASDFSRRRSGQDVKWIMQDSLELAVGKFHTGREVPLLSDMQRLFIETYQLVEVPSTFKKKKDLTIREVIRKFEKGETLGLAPELEASTDLKRGNKRAGQLVNLLARISPDGNIQPVYANSQGNQLSLKFGEAKKIGEFIDRDYQLVADRLMDEIQKLVP